MTTPSVNGTGGPAVPVGASQPYDIEAVIDAAEAELSRSDLTAQERKALHSGIVRLRELPEDESMGLGEKIKQAIDGMMLDVARRANRRGRGGSDEAGAAGAEGGPGVVGPAGSAGAAGAGLTLRDMVEGMGSSVQRVVGQAHAQIQALGADSTPAEQLQATADWGIASAFMQSSGTAVNNLMDGVKKLATSA